MRVDGKFYLFFFFLFSYFFVDEGGRAECIWLRCFYMKNDFIEILSFFFEEGGIEEDFFFWVG